MIYVGIDISKYKHDCFICNDLGEIIVENLSFENTKKGFQQFLDLLYLLLLHILLATTLVFMCDKLSIV